MTNEIYPEVDTAWFEERIDRVGLTKSLFAKSIGVDPGQARRMLIGKNNFLVPHALRACVALRVSFRELASHLGYDTSRLPYEAGVSRGASVAESPQMPLLGTVDADGNVRRAAVGRSIARPAPDVIGALRVNNLNSAFDGAILHFCDQAPVRECVGRMCLLELADKTQIVGALRAGIADGRYDVAGILGAPMRLEDVEVLNASPIKMIQLP